MTNNTAPSRPSLADKIAARLSDMVEAPIDTDSALVQELTALARTKKMSAAKLPVKVIEDAIAAHYAAPEVDPIDEAVVTSARAARGSRKCSDCGITITKKNRCVGLGVTDLCAYCYDAAATENEHLDNDGHALGGGTFAQADGCRLCGTYNPPKPQVHTSHDACDHPKTPAARAKCRRQREIAAAQPERDPSSYMDKLLVARGEREAADEA